MVGNDRWIKHWPKAKPILLHDNANDHLAFYLELIQMEHRTLKEAIQDYNSWLQDESFNEIFRTTCQPLLTAFPYSNYTTSYEWLRRWQEIGQQREVPSRAEYDKLKLHYKRSPPKYRQTP